MASEFQKKMDEWSSWFLYHRQDSMPTDLKKHVEFLQKCVDGQFHLLWLACQEIQEAKSGNKHALLLPSGLRWSGSLTELG